MSGQIRWVGPAITPERFARAHAVAMLGFWDCAKPDCDRLVKMHGMYCCTPCNVADGNGPTGEKYEIHAHSEFCDERLAERLKPGLDLAREWETK